MLNRWRNIVRAAGFSLVELLVVVGILSVLSALAAPSFSLMVANHQVRTGAEGVLSGLQLARTEAIRRNTNVSFTLNTGTGWTVATVSPASNIQIRPANEAGRSLQVTSLNGQTSLTFTPMGEVFNYSAGSNLTRVTVAPSAAISDGDNLRIDVSAAGQIRMCNPAITITNDPRIC